MVILKMEWRGVEQWKLVGLITQRSLVRIQPPLPKSNSKWAKSDGVNMTDFVPLFDTSRASSQGGKAVRN